MQSNAPVPAGQPGGTPEDPKLVKQRKREEAERQKKIQQEKKRQQELNLLITNFNRTVATSVMDTPTMYRHASNTLKSMLQFDHVAVAVFENHQEIRPDDVCVCRGEGSLPKQTNVVDNKQKALEALQKKKEEEDRYEIKRIIIGDEIVETKVEKKREKLDEEKKKLEEEARKEELAEIERNRPYFPVPPKDPPKPGTLPRLERTIWDMPLIHKMREIKQLAMIPDASKFPDPEVVKFASIFGIKSILFLPLIHTPVEGESNEERVSGIVAAVTITEMKGLNQTDITFAQKLVQALSKAISNAPPDLPPNVKKVMTAISKDEATERLMDFYNSILDDIFDMVIYELGVENCPERFLKLLEESEKIAEDSKLKKIWFQINELIRTEGPIGSIGRRAIQEAYIQSMEFTKARNGNMPSGLKGLHSYMMKHVKFDELKGIEISDEVVDGIEDLIDKALRGESLFTEKKKAVLLNDIEQSNMIMNYIAAPGAIDFRNHIRAAVEEADCPEEVDKDVLVNDLTYNGLSEISKVVCQDLVEKALFEIPEYLEQPQEKQTEQCEALVIHFHRKVMSNLVAALKGKKSVWVNLISNQIKERAKESAKKRAVLVGRMSTEQEEEEY